LANSHHDPAEQAQTHRALTRAWGMLGDHHRALSHASCALDLYRTLARQAWKAPVWEASTLNDMGWRAARLGDYKTARTYLPGSPNRSPVSSQP
jgi:hypothetical protein